MIQKDIMDNAMKYNFTNISISETMSDNLTVFVNVHCVKGQKFKKRKYLRFYKWLKKNKPVFTRIYFNNWLYA